MTILSRLSILFRYWRIRRAARLTVRSGLAVMLDDTSERYIRGVAAGRHRLERA